MKFGDISWILSEINILDTFLKIGTGIYCVTTFLLGGASFCIYLRLE